MIPHLPPPPLPQFSPPGGADDGGDDFPRRDERVPQWSNQETREFIEIRAQLEWDFITAKRNKNLWEAVANRMREKGYRRTADQCKCKWKNLVNRYKGQEASDVENGRQCPFFNELHTVFTARANQMPPHVDTESTGISKGKKRLINISEDQSHHEEFSEDETTVPKRKPGREKKQQKIAGKKEIYSNKNESILNGLRETMRGFMAQQQRIDVQWKDTVKKRAHQRDIFEQEWRQTMERLERERLLMERAWREREEQRRSREENRAVKRDALLTTLLNKLLRDEISEFIAVETNFFIHT
ncbi:PREDICTED: trihelix transcription factor GT-3b-like [Erythranthe guttata]|nr:PREDICTED: trihelix transcription factor GT-3b-like [Erythranthe guttata]|eukprot:XP_012847080.1 PREDICTED: trihelix transcription factor GT-3b-like [Erythranthe guttata]